MPSAVKASVPGVTVIPFVVLGGAVGVGVGDATAEGVAVGDAPAEGVAVGDAPAEGVAVGDAPAEGVAVGEAPAVGVVVGVADAMGEGLLPGVTGTLPPPPPPPHAAKAQTATAMQGASHFLGSNDETERGPRDSCDMRVNDVAPHPRAAWDFRSARLGPLSNAGASGGEVRRARQPNGAGSRTPVTVGPKRSANASALSDV